MLFPACPQIAEAYTEKVTNDLNFLKNKIKRAKKQK